MDKPFFSYSGNDAYVFVCYAHDDAAIVYPELTWLHDQGVNIWYDEGIPAGSNWRAESARALAGAAQVLYYVSAASCASAHCNREIHFALDKSRDVLPVYLDEVELPSDLQIGLNPVQALNRGTDRNYRHHLLEALRRARSLDPAERRETSGGARLPDRRNRIAFIVSAIAASVALALGAWFWLARASSNPAPETTPVASGASIAVLPFVNVSGDPENDYFSDGVAEEILNALSRVESLRVAPRTSAFWFKGKDVEVRQIGKSLNVANILEGSVRRDGAKVRIQVEVIDTTTGFRVWSDSYDRKVEDIFAVQDEIAAAVANALRVKFALGAVPGTTTANVEAYNAFLKGRALTTYASAEAPRAAIGYLKRAVELDPNYGAAYGRLALVYALISVYTPLGEIAADWATAFDRALAINPRDADALAAKAYYVTLTQWDWKQAGELYQRAISAGISANGTKLHGNFFLRPLNKWSEMRALYNDTLVSDPYNIDILWDLATVLTLDGAPKEALRNWDRMLEIEPDLSDAWAGKAQACAALGDRQAARAALAKVDVKRMNPYTWWPYLEALWVIGDHEAVLRRLHELEPLASSDLEIRGALTWVYPEIGETEKALTAFEAAYAASEFAVLSIKAPSYTGLHGQPRYEALLEKMKLDDHSLRDAGLL